MTIGIDGNEANVKHPVGVSVYTLQLLTYFAYTATRDQSYVVYLRADPQDHMPAENEYFHYRVVRGPFAWSQLFLPLALFVDRRCEVFFSPAHYVPRFCPVPLVVTIHDLAYFYYPDEFLKKDLYKLVHWSRDAVSRSRRVIAVSKTTKRDIINHYHVPDDQIAVVYNGYEKLASPQSEKNQSSVQVNGKTLKDHSYILYVGTLQPRKNIPVLLDAFSRYAKDHPDHSLVLTGKKGWMYEEIYRKAETLGMKDRIIFTGYLPDSDVEALYSHALCYVLPSLYEGFGIPILEAMAHDCPVIASTLSSLPEVGGDACLYFDARDPRDLADKMHMISTDSKLRASLIREGRKRITHFSWKTCARETLEVIKSAAHGA